MFTADHEIDQEGMTVPYPSLMNEARSNHGFTDLRGRPELAAEVAEGGSSAELKNLLVSLAQPAVPFFTIGCDLGSHEEPNEAGCIRYVAGGYVQFMLTHYQDGWPDNYERVGHKLAECLEQAATDHDWSLRFVVQPVVLKLDDFDDLTWSLNACFFAGGSSPMEAVNSREALLATLRLALADGETLLQEDPD